MSTAATGRAVRLMLSVLVLASVTEVASAQKRPTRSQPAAGTQPNRAAASRRPGQNGPAKVSPRIERAVREAEQAYQRGDYKYTLELLASVLREIPEHHGAMYLRASARVELGNVEQDADLVRQGVLDAREAIRLESSRSPIYFLPYLFGMTQLAAIEERDEHAEVSLQIADHVLKRPRLTPVDRANLLYQRATANMQLRRYDDAEANFEQSLKADPKHLGSALGLAESQAEGGHRERALSSFSRAVRDFPQSPLAWNNRGMYRQKLGDLAGATADFTKAVEVQPTYFVALTNRGFTRLEAGDPEQAEQDLTASLRIRPDQSDVLSLRGTSRLRQGKVNAAVEDFREVIRLDATNAIAQADLAFALFYSQDYPAALQQFNVAARIDPDLRYLAPWQQLTQLYLGQAIADSDAVQQALSLPVDKRDWIHDLLVWLGGGLSNDELIETVSRQTKQIEQAQLCEAHFFIGMKLLHSSRREEAISHFRSAVATDINHLSAWRGAWLALRRLEN